MITSQFSLSLNGLWKLNPVNFSTPFIRLVIICCLLAFILVLAAYGTKISFNNFYLQQPLGEPIAVQLPVIGDSTMLAVTYKLHGEIHLASLSSMQFRIIPDDRLLEMTINGRLVDLSVVSRDKLSDFANGFSIDLSPYLKRGTNKISVVVWDRGGSGKYGFKMRPEGVGWQPLMIFAGILLLIPVCVKTAALTSISVTRQVLYGLIFIGNIFQVWLIFTYNPVDHIWSDPQRHWDQGLDMLRVDLMSMTDGVMYQLYIAALAKLSLKLPVLVAFYTCLLAVCGHWVWYRFFRELLSNKNFALAGWAFVSLLPSWTSIYSYFMQETLLIPLLGASLWATWRAWRKNNVASFVLMVALWTAAGLTRGIAIPLAAVACTWLWLVQDLKIRKAIYSMVLLLLILGPLTYRSYQTVQVFAPHGMGHVASIYGRSGKREIIFRSNKGGSQWTHIFASPTTGAEPFAPFSHWKSARSGQITIDVDFNKGSEDWKKAYEQVALTWKKYFWLTKENIIFVFFGPSWPDNNRERLTDVVNIHMRWLWAPAFLLAIAGMVRYRRQLGGQMLLPALLLTWFILQCLVPISVGEGRYRKPLEGLLLAQYILLAAAATGAIRSYSRGDYTWLRQWPTTILNNVGLPKQKLAPKV